MNWFGVKKIVACADYFIREHHHNGHGIHSPFLYRMTRNVFMDTKPDKSYSLIEELRKKSKRDRRIVQGDNHGAGSKHPGNSYAHFVRTSAVSPVYGRMLARLVKFTRPERVIELGTGTGISAMYMASANPAIPVYTVEANPWLAEQAKVLFESGRFSNIRQVSGTFDKTIESMLGPGQEKLMVFMDGDHTYKATIRYFNLFFPHLHPESIIILDDIRWSEEMYAAWKEIGRHPSVTVTIDLFFMGIVIFRRELSKQHFQIKFL